jgi:hypothetical protein
MSVVLERGDRVARYKRLLQAMLDRRPSGTRGRIAAALGVHRSFVTQITSPAYQAPLPAEYVDTVLALLHATPEEARSFRDGYALAHGPAAPAPAARGQMIVMLPDDLDPVVLAAIQRQVRDHASRLVELVNARHPLVDAGAKRP